ncbi:hypothetical protein AB1Y20_018171 [Prymnesium parvum]|uniref:Glycosyl transferase CAP10 domain-containing protein n=1 Tax=Prymnesium parvum TaxID=97485 RepID=A0AB34JNI8_PRYPA
MASEACAPLLVEQWGPRACVLNESYGCASPERMWTDAGCAGRFHCGASRALRRCVAPHPAAGRAFCSCSPPRTPPPPPRGATSARGVEQLPHVYVGAAGHWGVRGVFATDVARAERWVSAQSRYVAPGAFRAKVVNGSLWVKLIHARRQWMERTNVLRLVLMAVSAREGVAEADFTYVHNDEDPNPVRGAECGAAWPRHCDDTKLPLFTNARGNATFSIPLPDFSWVGWGTSAPPWCTLHATMAAAGAARPWAERSALGYFSGGLGSGHQRSQLKALANRSEAVGLLRVRDVSPRFYTLANSVKSGRDAPEPLSAACGYKYLLSVPGFGYSNRLKALLLCGAVVIHVEPYRSAQEFFRPMLVPGRHFVVVGSVREILPAIRKLRANDTLAQRIGRAGRRLVLTHLTMNHTVKYVRALLSAYSRVLRNPVVLEPGYARIRTAADLARLTRLCECTGHSKVCAGPEGLLFSPGTGGASPPVEGERDRGLGGEHRAAPGRGMREERPRRSAADQARKDRAKAEWLRREALLSESHGSSHCCSGYDCPLDICPEAV